MSAYRITFHFYDPYARCHGDGARMADDYTQACRIRDWVIERYNAVGVDVERLSDGKMVEELAYRAKKP